MQPVKWPQRCARTLGRRSARFGVLSLLCAALSAPAFADMTANTGDTAWILTATALVLFMTLPGLALFYGGLVQAKNLLSVFMQCFAIACLMSLVWLVCGYSIAFGPGESGLLGGFAAVFGADAYERGLCAMHHIRRYAPDVAVGHRCSFGIF